MGESIVKMKTKEPFIKEHVATGVSYKIATRAVKKSMGGVGRKINERIRMTSISSSPKVGMKGVARKINARIRMTSISSGAMDEMTGAARKINAKTRMTSISSRMMVS